MKWGEKIYERSYSLKIRSPFNDSSIGYWVAFDLTEGLVKKHPKKSVFFWNNRPKHTVFDHILYSLDTIRSI